MKVEIKTDEMLKFIIEDINAAIQANPMNPKIRQYLNERDACIIELQNREYKRITRKSLKFTGDPLTLPMNKRHSMNTDYTRKEYKSACIAYGLMKRFPHKQTTII